MVMAAGYGPTLFDDLAYRDTRHPAGGFYINHGGEVDWTDGFSGAGGSSNGIKYVPGHFVRYALNHNDLAIQAHEANFPDTDHEVAAIEEVHPSRFGRTRCAWFSPSCTHHAYCRGAKALDADARRSRNTMGDVVRWSEYHRYDVVVVENVVEVKLWCDHHSNLVKNKKTGALEEKGCSCGLSFRDWCAEMEKLGYIRQEVYLNSQHVLVPQSRDRLYVVWHREGIKAPNLDFTPMSYCSTCEKPVAGIQTWKKPSRGSNREKNPDLLRWGRYNQQYVLTCPTCTSVVAPAVIGSETIIDPTLPIEPIGARKKPIAEATRERIRHGLMRLGTTRPVQLQVGGNLYERAPGKRVWSLDAPLRTVTTSATMAMCVPAGSQKGAAVSGSVPTQTLTASDRLAAVMLRYGGQSTSPRTMGEPMPTITAHDRQIGVVVPNMTNNVASLPAEPTGAVTTGNRHMLVTLRNNGTVEPEAVPAATVAASGTHHGVLVYNGVPGFVRELGDAAGTVTGRDKQSLLVPLRTGNVPTELTQPMPALSTRTDAALLEYSDADIDECLFRMLKWPELAQAQGMHRRYDGQPYLLTARVPAGKGRFKELTDEQRVGFIGNAVASPCAEAIVVAVGDALAASS